MNEEVKQAYRRAKEETADAKDAMTLALFIDERIWKMDQLIERAAADKKQNLQLTDEERAAFFRAWDWIEDSVKGDHDYMELDEGYREACILANLLNKFAFTILRDMKRAG
jgi:hypothetical protein